MPAMDDLRAEVAAADTLMDQAAVFITGAPAVTQAAVDAAVAGRDAEAAAIMADQKTHADALATALGGTTPVTPTTPPVTVPPSAP